MPRGIPKNKIAQPAPTVVAAPTKAPAVEPEMAINSKNLSPSSVEGPARAGEDPSLPIIGTVVYVLCHSNGVRGALDMRPLHELLLLRRKLEAFGGELTIKVEYPEDSSRERPLTPPGLRAMYDRLTKEYSFKGNNDQDYNLVMDVFGPPSQRRLIEVIRQTHKEYIALLKRGKPITVDDLIQLAAIADPEQSIETSMYEMSK